MKRILVTGGNGTLGRSMVDELVKQGQQVRIMSRKPAPPDLAPGLEWAQADVASGEGVAAALNGVDAIVNCMSDFAGDPYLTDIAGTRDFLAQAKKAGMKFVLHISIIGIDRIMFPYYQIKLGGELVVIESGIPYLIARVAQFHDLVDWLLSPLRDVTCDDVTIPADIQFQTISTRDVAAHLAPCIIDGNITGRIEVAGPEVTTLGAMAQSWMKAQGLQHTIKQATATQNDLPFFDGWGENRAKGYNTSPENRAGSITWQDYLNQTYN